MERAAECGSIDDDDDGDGDGNLGDDLDDDFDFEDDAVDGSVMVSSGVSFIDEEAENRLRRFRDDDDDEKEALVGAVGVGEV